MNALICKGIGIDQHQQLIDALQIIFRARDNQHIAIAQLADVAVRLEQRLHRLDHGIGGDKR